MEIKKAKVCDKLKLFSSHKNMILFFLEWFKKQSVSTDGESENKLSDIFVGCATVPGIVLMLRRIFDKLQKLVFILKFSYGGSNQCLALV